jgi:hypothetical protein
VADLVLATHEIAVLDGDDVIAEIARDGFDRREVEGQDLGLAQLGDVGHGSSLHGTPG